MIQRKRFSMPWRLRNWDYLYGWALTDLLNTKGQIDQTNEEAKKKFNSQKTKLHQRLSKVTKDYTQTSSKEGYKSKLSKNLCEVKKEYALCMDGSLATLKAIVKGIKTKENLIHQALNELNTELLADRGIFTYLYVLFYWTKHADVLACYNEQEPIEIGYLENLLFTIVSHKANDEENLNSNLSLRHLNILAWRILINGWETFVRTSHKQYKWILEIFNSFGKYKFQTETTTDEFKFCSESINMDSFSPIIYFYLKFSHYPDFVAPEFPLKDYQVELIKPVDAYTEQDPSNLNNITKRTQSIKIKESHLIEPMGRLLIEDLSFLQYVRPYENQFEDIYRSYFVEENQSALKMTEAEIKEEAAKKEKAEQAKLKKPDTKPFSKAPAKQSGGFFGNNTAAVSKKKKSSVSKKSTTDKQQQKFIEIEPEVLKNHKEISNQLWKVLERALISAIDTPCTESVLVWKSLNNLLVNSWVEIEKVESEVHEWNYKLPFTKRVF
mmetsp:Transcript_5978/g.5296  ORF Transcript_5978/g.5296 Transcript_5978/m.5296 type:complete len:496 (-) Transcript_5978:179-1666(-)